MHKTFTCPRIAITIVLLLLFIAASSVAQQQKITKPSAYKATVAGTSMSLYVPAGFVELTDGSGYIHSGSASTIMIKDLPGTPYTALVESIKNGALEKDGGKLTKSEIVTTNAGTNGMIYTFTFTTTSTDGNQSIPFERMVFLTGDDAHTVWITANYPSAIKNYIEGDIRACMLSVAAETE